MSTTRKKRQRATVRRGRPPGNEAGRKATRTALPGLARERARAGLSTAALAALLPSIEVRGVKGPRYSRSAITGWELGDCLAPADVVPFLARALGCSGKRLKQA